MSDDKGYNTTHFVTTAQVNAAAGLPLQVSFIVETLKVDPAGKHKAAVLWKRGDVPKILQRLSAVMAERSQLVKDGHIKV